MTDFRRRIRIASIGLTIGLAATMLDLPAASQTPEPPSPILSPDDPPDVADTTQVPGNPIALFDEFSWRMFLTMVWPADSAGRGRPDRTRPLGASGPLVFETFRSNWEAFQPSGDPPGFDEDARITPCPGVTLPPAPFVIAAFSKFDELRQADFGTLAGPLPAQNRRYTRYATGYDRISYDHILRNRLFLSQQLGNVVFPDTSTVVKSAWIEMAGVPDPGRYYTRMAWIIDPETETCSEQLVGLVGLHIVRKTRSRPQWIWSTFEHVDTVPEPGSTRPLAYHSRDGRPMPEMNPYGVPTPQVPEPFNVERLTPIHPATEAANNRYRSELARRGSVWQNYRLVMTQWPLSIADPNAPGSPRNTFPGERNDTTAYANTTMETFEQTSIRGSCMACHNRVRQRADFIWSLDTHARPSGPQFFAMRRGPTANQRWLRAELERGQRSTQRALQARARARRQ